MSDPKLEWRGTIAVGDFSLAVRAFSAFARESHAPALYQVHRELCNSPADARVRSGKKRLRGERKSCVPDETSRGRVQMQSVCMRCGNGLKPHEVGWQVTMPRGAEVHLEPNDLDAMSFEKSKRIEGRPILGNDPMIEAAGIDRRLYLFPEPASIDAYWMLFTALSESRHVIFLPFIALAKDRAYVGVLRPLELPSELFGEEVGGKSRMVLVLDCVGDTDKLKDPAEFPGYAGEAVPPRAEVAKLRSMLVGSAKGMIRADECVNPKTARILRAVRNARRRALAS